MSHRGDSNRERADRGFSVTSRRANSIPGACLSFGCLGDSKGGGDSRGLLLVGGGVLTFSVNNVGDFFSACLALSSMTASVIILKEACLRTECDSVFEVVDGLEGYKDSLCLFEPPERARE